MIPCSSIVFRNHHVTGHLHAAALDSAILLIREDSESRCLRSLDLTDLERDGLAVPNISRAYNYAASPTAKHNSHQVGSVLRFLTLVVLATVTISSAVRGQTSILQRDGAVFDAIAADVRSDLAVLRPEVRGNVRVYAASDVNTLLEGTKAKTLAAIPSGDEPLREYVFAHFPSPVEDSHGVVPEPVVAPRFAALERLIDILTRIKSFLLNLRVATAPAEARFELISPLGKRLSTVTNSTLTGIYRGEYNYTVAKAGYKTIAETINFVEQSGDTLECNLLVVGAPDPALPCRFR